MNPALPILRRLRPHALPLAVLLVLIAIGYFRLLDPSFVLVHDIRTIQFFHLSWAASVFETTRTLPLWSPLHYGGFPFVGDPQPALWYPPTLLLVLLNAVSFSTIKLLVWLHLLAAAWGMYALGQYWFRSRAAAFAAACAYAFAGSFVAHNTHMGIEMAHAWLPLAFLLLALATDRQSWRWAVGGGAIGAFIILAGHFQSALGIFAFLGAYALTRAGISLWRQRRWRGLLPVGMFALFTAFSVGLAALQVLPTREFAVRSVRAELTLDRAQTESLDPTSLATLVIPNFFDNVLQRRYWGAWSANQNYLYFGAVLLVLAVTGLLTRRRLSWFFPVAALVVLLTVLGRFAFLQSFLYFFVPFFNKTRAAANFAPLLFFSLAMAAGSGLLYWQTQSPQERQRDRRIVTWTSKWVLLGFGIFLFNAVLAVAVFRVLSETHPATRGLEAIYYLMTNIAASLTLTLLVLAAAFVVLHRYNAGKMAVRTMTLLLLLISAVDLLGVTVNSKMVGRQGDEAAAVQPTIEQRFLLEKQRLSGEPFRTLAAPLDHFWGPTDLRFANGYNPLIVSEYNAFFEARLASPDFFNRVLTALNTRYVFSHEDGVDPALLVGWRQVADEMFENPQPTPYAWFVDSVTALSPGGDAVGLALRTDLTRHALVSDAASAVAGTYEQSGATVRAEATGPNAVRLRTNNARDGFLVVSEVFYPGWQAAVDGKAATIYQTDAVLRGIAVPAGTHALEMVFRPRSFIAGRMITFATFALWIILLATALFPRPRGVAAG